MKILKSQEKMKETPKEKKGRIAAEKAAEKKRIAKFNKAVKELEPDLPISIKQMAELHAIGRAIKHVLRLRILAFLNQKGEQTVTAIYVKIRIEQSVASQQLAILRKAGLVISDKQGKFVYYSINEDKFDLIKKLVD
jgi:DNA-binding transcriptional ArsR family regulator